MEQEEVAIDVTIPCEEEIEPFDWEDILYESWLEEQHRQKRQLENYGCNRSF
jgi:hypothetical protein